MPTLFLPLMMLLLRSFNVFIVMCINYTPEHEMDTSTGLHSLKQRPSSMLYLLKHKSDAFTAFKDYKAYAENVTG
jgi:hypothetical protein